MRRLMKIAARSGRACLACTSGLATLEFALVAPTLLTLLLGTLEFSRWSTARQHMEDYAFSVATDLSGTTTPVSAYTLREMIERIGIIAPELVDGTNDAWQSGNTTYLGVTISMYLMTASVATCRTSCSYTAKLVWTFGNNKRDCAINPVFTGASQPGYVVVVDVKSQYKFVFDVRNRLAAAPTLSTTIWLPVRNWRGTAAPDLLAGASANNSRETRTYGPWTGTTCP